MAIFRFNEFILKRGKIAIGVDLGNLKSLHGIFVCTMLKYRELSSASTNT
jgi:hypothetical protein